MRTISRMYDNYSDASAVVTRLEGAGISHDNISVIANEEAHGRHTSSLTGTSSAPGTPTVTGNHPADPADPADTDGSAGAKRGAVAGTVVGGAAALLAGIGALAIPGIGPLVAAGWLVTTLTGAGVGAAGGGLLGGLTGAGVSHEEAETYNEGVRRGGTVVAVRAEDADAARVESLMDTNAVNWQERRATYGDGFASTAPTDAALGTRTGSTLG